MIIRSVNVRRFGKLAGEQIEFEDGLNIVYGPNESGKSTLRGFIVNMLFGMKRSRGRSSKTDDHTRYEPADGTGGYSGSIEIEEKTGTYIIKRNFSAPLKRDTVLSCTDGEVTSAADADGFFMNGMTRDEYINTAAPLQGSGIDGDLIMKAVSGDPFDDMGEADEADIMREAIQKISEQRKTAEKRYRTALSEREKKLSRIRSRIEYEQEESKDPVYAAKTNDALYKRKKPAALVIFLAAAALFAMAAALNKELRIVFMTAAAISAAGGAVMTAILRARDDQLSEETERLRDQIANEERMARGERLERLGKLYEEAADDEDVRRAEADLKSTMTAYETMQKIAGAKKRRFNKKLSRKVETMLRELLEEPDLRIIFDPEMNYMLLRGDVMIKDWRCSEGTKNLINQVIRLSAAELSGTSGELPLILDDALVNLDDNRCENILKMLAGCGRQVILFTCQKREIRMLDKMGLPYERVRWSGNC